MGLIHQYHHPMVMGQFGDFPKIGTDSVIRGIIDQNGFCIRMFQNGFFYIFYFHSKGDSQPVIGLGIDIYRNGAA